MTSKIFLLAGEASGDLLGGKLIESLKNVSPTPIEFIGIGGPHMEEAGLKSLFPMSELSIMGIFEVIKHLPHILKRMNQVKTFIEETRPDVVITIDLPDFSFRLAKKIRRLKIPHIHYTAPSVWAWRPGRAKKIAQFLDHLLCLLPFEPPYFTVHGLKATFVGHMITQLGIEYIPKDAFRKKHHIKESETLICMLPGSRAAEVTRLLPVFKETIQKIALLHPHIKVAVPTVESVRDMVVEGLKDLNLPILYIQDQDERYAAMRACNAALAASGTVSLELSMAHAPTVIAYKINPITTWVARKIVRVKYMTLTNILLEKEVIPEFFQEKCTADNLFLALNNLLMNEKSIAEMREYQSKAMGMLTPESMSPSDMAAKTVLGFL